MPRPLSIALVLLGTPMTLPGAFAMAEPPAPATPATTFSASRVIVEWEPGVSRGDRAEAREDAEVSLQANLGDPAFQLVKVESGQTVAGAIEELRSDPAVAIAERDSYSAPTSLPDDPLLGQEWGLENLGGGVDGFAGAVAGADIDAPGAWDHTVGTASTVVADIDSGYRFDSPDLGPVAWEDPGEVAGNSTDDDGNGYVDDAHGYDFVGTDAEAPSQDADPTDDNLISGGHGVHTAGTIGGAGNNGVGITGVAQDVRTMPLRVCANAPKINEERCPTSSIIAAINYAGANGARAANISLSGTVKSTAELDAFAESPQTLFVIAAGNDSQDNDSVEHYPCDYEPGSTPTPGAVENIVCVAATNQADELASFSDWGPNTVDLGAPGTEILSTYPAMEGLVEDNFEQEDFETRWNAGVDGGFARTDEAPLTSFGMSDSPEATPVANSERRSTLSSPVAVPAGDGACRFSGRDFISLGGGSFSLVIFKNGFPVHTFQIPSTSGPQLASFTTVPMTDLAGANVGVRVRYVAGPSPSASDGVWLDDLKLSCYAPVSTPPEYEYLQGTSMAAPHVTGTAALLFSSQPAASVAAVRHALLASVDPDPSLDGKTTTGGRLDAASALADLDTDAPAAPVLSGTDPASPANENEPRILGSAEAEASVAVFAGVGCEGLPLSSGTAAELKSPGIGVEVPDNSTSQFTATATDAAENTSPCSLSISYTNTATIGPSSVIVVTPPLEPLLPNPLTPAVPPPSCTVPKLAGKTLGQAKAALGSAGCRVGKVTKPRARRGHAAPALVVKSSSPDPGAVAPGAIVNLTLGRRPKKHHH